MEEGEGAFEMSLANMSLAYTDTTMQRAEALLDFLECDFGQSGRDVRLEAIRQEIDAAYRRGLMTDE